MSTLNTVNLTQVELARALPDRNAAANSSGCEESGEKGEVHLLRGREAILGCKPILDDLAQISDQRGASDDLLYHLSTPDALKKVPCLVLVPAEAVGPSDSVDSVGGFCGAVLLFEYKILGKGSKIYASADTTGRRAVIAPVASRARIAACACRGLLSHGAEIVMVSVHEPGDEEFARSAVTQELTMGKGCSGSWSLTVRDNPLYLPLAKTFDQTLSSIGKKTRTNLRYYRRRAESELGSAFVPNAEIGLDEFLAFNRLCSYPISDELAQWRYESLNVIERPFLHGVRDGMGRWLSLASGRLTADHAVLEWQCNRADLPAASLSTVMRSYLIDYKVRQGVTRLYFEGGTPTSLQKSFVVEGAADLTVCRRSAYAWMIRKLAGRIFPPKNYLAQILTDSSAKWTRC